MPKRRSVYKKRRAFGAIVAILAVVMTIVLNPNSYESFFVKEEEYDSAESGNLEPLGANTSNTDTESPLATEVLEKLEVKGRAPKTGYSREQFYETWPNIDGCSLRQHIIKRELGNSAIISETNNCTVVAGEYDEPYTGSHLVFYQKTDLSNKIQIDHIVALSDAWQKGAQQLTMEERYNFATDPLNLIAVEAKANQDKSDGDAATWLPPNKQFRCTYVARQISVKYKYKLWVTKAEKEAITNVLVKCPSEPAVGVSL